MRGWTVTLIIFLCAVVVGVAFHFLAVVQLDRKLAELRQEDDKLNSELVALVSMESEIPELFAAIPSWQERVSLYRSAIPSQIEDEVFLGHLSSELRQRNVQLLTVQLNPSGSWLGNLKEEDAKKLEDMGVDVEVARQLRVAFYSMQLNGRYGDVIQAFENMKRYRRIYSIDQIISPSGGGGGQVLEVLDDSQMPMQVTGKIFYGVPANYVSEAQLEILLIALQEEGGYHNGPADEAVGGEAGREEAAADTNEHGSDASNDDAALEGESA